MYPPGGCSFIPSTAPRGNPGPPCHLGRNNLYVIGLVLPQDQITKNIIGHIYNVNNNVSKTFFSLPSVSYIIISFELHNNPLNSQDDMVSADPKIVQNCVLIFFLKYITCSLNKLQKHRCVLRKNFQLPVIPHEAMNPFILCTILYSIYMYCFATCNISLFIFNN